jgi:hypothetical protein
LKYAPTKSTTEQPGTINDVETQNEKKRKALLARLAR